MAGHSMGARPSSFSWTNSRPGRAAPRGVCHQEEPDMAGVLVSYCLLVHDWCTPDCHVAVAGCTENCGGIASYGCGGGGTYRGLQTCSPTPDTRGFRLVRCDLRPRVEPTPPCQGGGGADLRHRGVLVRYCPGASPQQSNRQRTASTAIGNKQTIRTRYRRSSKRGWCRPTGTHRQRFTASGHTVGAAVFYLKGEMPT